MQLNELFPSVFTGKEVGQIPLAEKALLTKQAKQRFKKGGISETDKLNKSSGPDGIHLRVLRNVAVDLLTKICNIFINSHYTT